MDARRPGRVNAEEPVHGPARVLFTFGLSLFAPAPFRDDKPGHRVDNSGQAMNADTKPESEPIATPPASRPEEPARAADAAAPPREAELRESVARIETLVREIRTTFESHVREERHRDFSFLLLAGVVVQVAAGGMLLLAGLDWLFAADQVGLFIKAIFAIVLQGMAMTALLMSRGGK